MEYDGWVGCLCQWRAAGAIKFLSIFSTHTDSVHPVFPEPTDTLVIDVNDVLFPLNLITATGQIYSLFR